MINLPKKVVQPARPKTGTKAEPIQPTIKGRVSHLDIIAPSSIREIGPGMKSSQENTDGYWVEVGDPGGIARRCRSFYASITGNGTQAGMLNSLYTADVGEADCDVAIHIAPADTVRTVWALERDIARMEADYAEEANSARRNNILKEIHELQRRHGTLRTGEEKLFYTSIQVTVSTQESKDLKQVCSLLTRRMATKNLVLKACDMRQLEALMNATPLGDIIPRDAYQDMESSNIADLFPFGTGGLHHQSGVIIGRDRQDNIIFYNGWHPKFENYNIVVFGRSGAGKSFLVKLLSGRSALVGIQTIIIDPQREYENEMTALGCPYISLSPGSGDMLNVFDVDLVEDEGGAVKADLDEAVKAVQAMVFRMIRVMDEQHAVLTGQTKVGILEKIRELYNKFGITEDPKSIYAPSSKDVIQVTGIRKRMPQLSDLVALMRQDETLKDATRIVNTFTKEGGTPAQSVFDCQTTVQDIWQYPMLAFSVAGLDEEIMRPLGLFITTRWSWNKLSRNRKRRKRLIVDEAQIMMDTPETARWFENAFRTARKRNISMCACTQGFEVFLRGPEGMGILKNATTQFLMKQESIDIASVREKFALSDGEAEFLLTAQKGWGIIKAGQDASVFFGEATDREYRMFTSDPNDLAYMQEQQGKKKK